ALCLGSVGTQRRGRREGVLPDFGRRDALPPFPEEAVLPGGAVPGLAVFLAPFLAPALLSVPLPVPLRRGLAFEGGLAPSLPASEGSSSSPSCRTSPPVTGSASIR